MHVAKKYKKGNAHAFPHTPAFKANSASGSPEKLASQESKAVSEHVWEVLKRRDEHAHGTQPYFLAVLVQAVENGRRVPLWRQSSGYRRF
jgi:hypothetical protein